VTTEDSSTIAFTLTGQEVSASVLQSGLALNNLGEKSYNSLTDKPTIPTSHGQLADIGSNTHADIDIHISDVSNPHNVTKDQVGLANVDNVAQVPFSYLDTDETLANNSDIKVATQKAVKAYIDSQTGGASSFLDLTDTPNDYTGQAGKVVTVNGTEDALIFTTSVSSDEKVKYDVSDPSAGYISDKIIAGDGISVAEGIGADENKLVITNTDKGSDVDLSGKEDVGVAAGLIAGHELAYDHTLIATALQDISGQDLSTADNSTSQFITQGDIDWATNVPANETDPIYTSWYNSGDATLGSLQFNTAHTPITNAEGLLQWNTTDGTLDLGMSGGDITQQIGQELFIHVYNDTGVDIPNGSPVCIVGRQGNLPKVALARSDAESTANVIGLATQDIPSTGEKKGYVTSFGLVRQIKTNYSGDGDWGTTWASGDNLYISKTIAGQLTNVEPDAPHHSDIIGQVGTVGALGVGSIAVYIRHHTTMEELCDINGTALTTDGQFPVWNNTAGYFDFNYNINDYLTAETDPVFTAHPAYGLTSDDMTDIGNLSGTNTGDQDLSGYAKLDATNQPFTGNVTLSKANPVLKVTDTGLNSSAWLEKDTTLDGSRLVSQNRLYTLPNSLTLAGATRGDGLNLTSTGALSVSFWWKTSSAGDSYFCGDADASSDFRWGSGLLSFTDEAAGLARYWSAGAYGDNTWRMITLTISSDRATVKAYINGTLATQTQAGTVGGNFLLTRIFATNGNTNGSFDDFKIYTKELSQAEVTALYNSGNPTEVSDMTSMYAYYKLNETSGTSASDSSGNGRTVTLTGGTPVWETGKVTSAPNPLTDIPVLRLANNTTTSSYGTLTNGYYSGSFGTSNIYDGLSHTFRALGTSKMTLTSSGVNISQYTGSLAASGALSAGTSVTASTYIQAGTSVQAGTQLYSGAGLVGTAAVAPASDTNTGIYYPAADTWAVTTGGTERLRIGTSLTMNAGTDVELITLSKTTGGSYIQGLQRFSADTQPSMLFFRKSRGTTVNSHAAVQNGDALGGFLIQGSQGTTWANSVYIVAHADDNFTSTSSPGRLGFFTSPSGSTTVQERMRINSAGNVGIGTPSSNVALSLYRSGTDNPAFRLEDGDITIPSYSAVGFNPTITTNTVGLVGTLGGSVGGAQYIGFSNSTYARAVAIVGYSGKTAVDYGPVSLVAFKHNGTTDRTAILATEPAIDFFSGASVVSRIMGDGSLGLGTGTTNPSARLHAISTTEQLRLGYDASNYYSTTVGSAGEVTLDAVGAGAGFTFSDSITMADAKDLIFNTTTGTKIGTATSQKIGFWNATPVVQPTTAGSESTFTENAGTVINDDSTFDGYTIGQVVKALRTMGVLA
jgi:hypothetical protein